MSTDPSSQERIIPSVPRHVRLWALGGLLCFVVVAVVLICFGNVIHRGGEKELGGSDAPIGKTDPQTDGETTTAAGQGVSVEDGRRKELELLEAQTRRNSRLIEIRGHADRLRDRLDELTAQRSDWQTTIESLMTNEKGRRLAASRAHVEQFVAIYEKPRVSQEEIQKFGERRDELTMPVDAAEKDSTGTYLPSELWKQDVEALIEQVSSALRELSQDQRIIGTLVEDVANEDPAEVTLMEAIGVMEKEEERRRARVERDARQKAEEEWAAKIAKEMDREVAEQEAQKHQRAKMAADNEAAKTAQLKADAKARAIEIEAERKMAELERRYKALWPKMEPYMTPFTSHGYTQPQRGNFVRTSQKGPVSYRSMISAGLLGDDIQATKTLHYATAANKMNDRPLGAFPDYRVGNMQERLTIVQQVHDFLVEFGPLMVDKKLLAE